MSAVQPPLQLQIEQKITLVKTRIEEVVRQIRTGSPWNREQRPRQLGNQGFVKGYAQPRYWDIKKPLVEQDKNAPAGSRITIEERPFRVSNSDIDCLQVNLKDFTKISLERHDSIMIQSHKEYLLLKSSIDFVRIEINHLVDLFNRDNRKVDSIEQELKIERELCMLDVLSQPWQYESKDYPKENHNRIIAVILNRKRFDENLYIYKQELIKMPSNPAEFTTFISRPEDVQFMLEILKIHHLRDRHAKYLKDFKDKFQDKVKKSLVNGYIKTKEEKQNEKKRIYENLNRKMVIENYESLNSKIMLEDWHKKAKMMQVSKVKNLFIEVEEIWISKGVAPDRLKLIIETEQPQNEDKLTTFGFRNMEGSMLVYKQTDSLPKCSKIILKEGTFGKAIHFKVIAQFKGKTTSFQDYYIENNIESDNFAFTHELKLLNFDESFKDRNCFLHFNIIQTKKMSIARTSDFHIAAIFKNVGKIPTKYKSSLNIDYTPSTFPLIRQLINKSSSSKLNKETFQTTYFALVDFIQKEENLSQSATLENKVFSSGIPMKQRAEKYLKKLQIDLNFDVENLNDIEETQIFNELQRSELQIETKQYKNLIEDLKRQSIRFKSYIKDYMVKFIYFISRRRRLFNFTFNLRYMSHLLPIAEKFIIIIFNKEQAMRSTIRQSFIYREESDISTFYTFLAFIAKLYPYADIANLKTDLFILRWLVQKNLTYFNDYLNRNHIGLQNFIAPYLLTLFCGLSQELTFRIWDFLLMSPHKDKARIVVAYTLLAYMETTATLPIIPINQFMETVENNMRNLGVDREYGIKFNKVAESYYKDEINRHKRLEKIIKNNPANSVIEDKHLQKIILGSLKSRVPVEQEGKVSITKQHTEQQKTVTIDKIIYPLPKANHNGFPILQMQIFIHNLNILDNLNLTAHKFHLQFEMNEPNWRQNLQVLQRNYYYNKSIVVPAIAVNRESTREIVISIAREGQGKVLVGSLNYSKFYKDKSYRCSIVLRPTTGRHNKGETVLNLSFCMKSIIFPNSLEVKKYQAFDLLSEKILDYDIGQSNQSMVALQRLRRELERIKYPLDEFGSDQFKRLQNSSLNFFETQLLQTSKTSIQQLKTIFYNIFAHDSDKQIRHQFSKYYEIYAQQHNLQFIYFLEMMIRFVLLADITKKKKMTYLYCLSVHYQNCYSKKINAETVNSLIRLVSRQNTFVNACPYSRSTMGRIVEAYYFEADLKNIQLKKDFTQILQDWAYICNFKLGYSSVILGSWRDLSILRSLFDLKTIKAMENQPECRFEVVYEIDGTRYLWSTVVETKTFTILKRGTKFLNSHASFGEIKFLSSTQEYLLNCQNIIPLQNHKNYTYQEFSQQLLENSLFTYMVEMPSLSESLPNRKLQQTKIKLSSASEVLQYDEIQKRQYADWAIFRNQNCLQTWKRCKIISVGPVLSKVIFQFDHNEYSVSSVDVVSMQEINLNQDKK